MKNKAKGFLFLPLILLLAFGGCRDVEYFPSNVEHPTFIEDANALILPLEGYTILRYENDLLYLNISEQDEQTVATVSFFTHDGSNLTFIGSDHKVISKVDVELEFEFDIPDEVKPVTYTLRFLDSNMIYMENFESFFYSDDLPKLDQLNPHAN